MARRSKKYQKINKKLDKTKTYSLDEAIDFIKENKAARFDESIEIHLKLGINLQKTEENIRGNTVLPYSGFSQKKIVAFVEPEKEKEAREAGADIVGGRELIERIKETQKIDFDIAVATPKIMKELILIAKILGQKGIMPSPKTGTLTENIKEAIGEFKKGKLFFKNDAGGNLHMVVGKSSWEKEKIMANVRAFLETVRKAKPSSVKRDFIKNITLSSTMGPGFKIKI